MSSPLSSFFNKPQVATNVPGDQNKNLTVPVNGTCSVPDAQQGTSSLYPSKNQTVYTPAQAGRNTQNMCIDPNLANLRSDGRANAIAGMSPQNPSNIASYSPVISGAGLGLWTGLKYMPQVPEKELVQPTLNQFINKKDLSKALPDVIRKVKNFPDGQIPKEGLKLDFGSGRISPHDAKNVLGISRFELTDPGLSAAQIKSVKYVPKSPTIVTYQNVENSELQVLKYLDEQGFKTSKIYYENVPALPGQRAETFKLFDNVLKPGGKIELTPRSAEIQNAFSEKNLVNARSYADDIANELKNSVKGNIVGQPSYTPRLAHPKVEILSADNVFKYTIQKADDVDNSLLAAAGKEGALMSKVAKTTGFMKTAVTKAAPVVRYAVPILIVAGIVLDGIDLYNAYQKDKEEGGYRNTVETSGKIAGTWAGGLAGAKIGAVAGFCIGGPIGAAIGAVAGGIVGGLIGAYAGKEIASTGYDIATGEGPVTNTRVPMHETISTQYEYSPAITMPEGFNNNFDASYFMPNNITLDYGATSQALQGTISYDASLDLAPQASR